MKCSYSKLLKLPFGASSGVLLLCATLLNCSVQAQVPPLCQGNGSQGSINFCLNPPACDTLSSSRTVHVGDTVNYELEVGIQNGRCSATNVNAFVKFPDGRVIQFLSGATLIGSPAGGASTAIRCPGDPQCINTAQYFYVVRSQDIGSNFCVVALSTLRGNAISNQSC